MTIFVERSSESTPTSDEETMEFSAIDSQNRIHSLNDAFQECKECDQSFFVKRTLQSWYLVFSNWVSAGYCSLVTRSVIPGQQIVIPEDQFYECLDEWFLTDWGRYETRNIVLDAQGKIKAWRQYITPIDIRDVYGDGLKFLKDMHMLEGRYGIPDTYTYSEDMLLYEQFVVLVSETCYSILCSLAAVLVVTFVITASFRLSTFAFISVTLIDLFIVALIPLVGLHFNNIVL